MEIASLACNLSLSLLATVKAPYSSIDNGTTEEEEERRD
jgi:hypothetical protein